MDRDELLRTIEEVNRNGTTMIDLSSKGISELPPEIGQLTNLIELDLSENRLSELPPEIGQLTALTGLGLSGNQLCELPPEINQLTALVQLILHSNQLCMLPPEIDRLTALSRLYLTNNQLREVPPEIGQLTALTELYLASNQLVEVPPEIGLLINLRKLDLRDNKLTSLPREIQNLTQLERLDLHGNPDLGIPEEIVNTRNSQTILEYYFSQARCLINEVKVILVGQGDVGKTALVRRLKENRFEDARHSTPGVNIVQWRLQVGDHNVRLNLWDFGGQNIMHATHQFFFTRRTLYLLVLDVTQDELQNKVAYWLNMIRSIAGEDAPIIVVQNKADQWDGRTHTHIQPFMRDYPQIKGEYFTSCRTGQGVDTLTTAMAEVIGMIDGVHDEWPVAWLNVKEALEAERGKRDVIDYRGYHAICEEQSIDEPEVRDGLLQFLHELGVVLSFADDWRLVDRNILNPEWVTEGVYKITTAVDIEKAKGVLDVRKHLPQILPRNRYMPPDYPFILARLCTWVDKIERQDKLKT